MDTDRMNKPPKDERRWRPGRAPPGAEQQNAMPGQPRSEITFERSRESDGYPEPLLHDLNDLSDRELASYIAASGSQYDGMGLTLREAVVRLLRR